MSRRAVAVAAASLSALAYVAAVPADAGAHSLRHKRAVAAGPTQHGKASYYHMRFSGRRMANGKRFDPRAETAAHRTLPFGTRVLVTNLENGRSAVVEVTDRGPYVSGRIIDLAPRVAEELDMKEEGVVRVTVTPLSVPQELAEAP